MRCKPGRRQYSTRWEPNWEPPGRTTSPARRTSADKRLAIMPGPELIWTALNAVQVTTDL